MELSLNTDSVIGDVLAISGDDLLVGDDGEDCLVGLFGGGGSSMVKTSDFFLGFFGNFFKHKLLTNEGGLPISGDDFLEGDDGEDCLVGLFGGGGSPLVKTSHFFSDSLGLSLNTDCSPMKVFSNFW